MNRDLLQNAGKNQAALKNKPMITQKMKAALTIIALVVDSCFFSLAFAAGASSNFSEYGELQSRKEKWDEKHDPDKDGYFRLGYSGSEIFKQCQELAHMEWPKMVDLLRDKEDAEGWKQAWGALARSEFDQGYSDVKLDAASIKTLREINRNLKAASYEGMENHFSLTSSSEAVKEANEKLKELAEFYQKMVGAAIKNRDTLHSCEALVSMTTHVDFNNRDEVDGDYDVKASPDKVIVCRRVGAETQDFPACKQLITAYITATVAKQGVQSVQSMDYQGFAQQKNQELASDKTGGSADSGAFGIQKDSLEKQEDYSNQRAGLNAATLAGFNTILNRMPTRESLVEECNNKEIKGDKINEKFKIWIDKIEQQVTELNTAIGVSQEQELSGDTFYGIKIIKGSSENVDSNSNEETKTHRVLFPDPEENQNIDGICGKTVGEAGQITLNDPAREAVKQLVMQEGAEAVKNLLNAADFGKKAAKVDEAMKELAAFQPQPFPTPIIPEGQEETTTDAPECLVNPQSANCVASQDTVQGVGFGGGFGFGNVGASGSASTSGKLNNNELDNNSATRGDGIAGRAPGSIGAITGSSAGKKGNGFDGGVPGSAGGMASRAPAYGGGSGGGGGASAGAGGGGGSRGAAGAGENGGAYRKTAVSFGGKGGGSLSYSGGGGRRGSQKRADNPLAGLLKNKKDNNGKVLGYGRGPASQIGNKKGSIFYLISSGYQRALTEKRLLEYETKKGN